MREAYDELRNTMVPQGFGRGGEVGGPSNLAIYSADCFGILGIVNICYTEPNGTENPHEMEV